MSFLQFYKQIAGFITSLGLGYMVLLKISISTVYFKLYFWGFLKIMV